MRYSNVTVISFRLSVINDCKASLINETPTILLNLRSIPIHHKQRPLQHRSQNRDHGHDSQLIGTRVAVDPSTVSDLTPIAIAARGQEVTGLEIFQRTTDDITVARAEELVSEMNVDKPTGGTDMAYGNGDAQHLCFRKAKSSKAPIVLFVPGGSWRSGTYLHSIGSAKVGHLTGEGYAFASNYTLIPSVTVEDSGAHVVTLLGTDPTYLERAGINIHIVRPSSPWTAQITTHWRKSPTVRGQ
ncbi:hypothetical protein SI65_04325 [Aspergillus cristatus]|uniref:Uncharacterized protein n=1 Tax=Aspergillus cristatus TaxID=573508 RepID=A0A1E3BJW2_ASPCR|nr:hypothetical protein SI65_04325 [Aspergillus cristatus]